MSVGRVVVLVEELSMEEALRLLLPKLLGATEWEVHRFRSKTELLKKLPSRLQGYASWLPADWRIVVLVDRDDDDCAVLKARLEAMASEAGLATKSQPEEGRFAVVNRVVIEELESWYFGDWSAVRTAYPKVRANVPKQAPYRLPDQIKGGTWEAFERVMRAAGYFKTGLRKVEAARAVAEHMDPSRNSSPSFCALREALLEMRTA